MKKLALILSTLLFIFSSCTDKSIKYNGPDVVNVVLQQSYDLKASSKDPLNYSSDNERYVTVSFDGVVYGKNVGKANVTLSNTENELTIPVNVNLYEEPTFDFGASPSKIKSLYGEPTRNYGDSVFVYGGGQIWYSPTVWEMNFFFGANGYYESDLYLRNDLDLLLTKFLDENYYYYQALNDTINGEVKTIHIYLDTEDPRFADIIVGKQYNVGKYNDILLVYAPFQTLNSRMSDIVTKERSR